MLPVLTLSWNQLESSEKAFRFSEYVQASNTIMVYLNLFCVYMCKLDVF